MSANPGSQAARVLHALKDGEWVSISEIYRRAGSNRLNSVIARLRKDGWLIEHRTVAGKPRPALAHQYQLQKPWPEAIPDIGESLAQQMAIKRDSVPRDDEHRFRIYVVDDRNRLLLMAAAATEEKVGVEICRLGRSGVVANTCVGILDTHGLDKDVDPGEWLVNPWDAKTT